MNRKLVNGLDVDELLEYQEQIRKDSTQAERNPVLVAQWAGGPRARIEREGIVIHMGGDDDLSAMSMLLASLAACDVEVIATHAALKDITIKSLSIEARGHFNIARLMGIENSPGPGYDDISYRVRIEAPGATREQIEYLRKMCEQASPVGDSLSRRIPLKIEFEIL